MSGVMQAEKGPRAWIERTSVVRACRFREVCARNVSCWGSFAPRISVRDVVAAWWGAAFGIRGKARRHGVRAGSSGPLARVVTDGCCMAAGKSVRSCDV
jgi:hypothetical protein